jgi:hypothetical protein
VTATSVEARSASPKWQHDCQYCTYLGATPDIDGAQLDLYVCKRQRIPTVLARYGHQGHQYLSGMTVAAHDPHLFEARKRAIAQGHLPDDEVSK